VAVGAAIQGTTLLDDESDVLLLDVTPHALGIMIMDGSFDVIIPANTRVPTAQGHIFTTVRDNQTAVKIMVFQGDSNRAIDNELLGEFVLAGLRGAPAGEVEIEVTFDINADGIVSVSAKDLETGRIQAIEVTASSGLTEEEIQQMMDEHKDYAVGLRSSEDLEKRKVEVQRAIGEIEKLMPEVQAALEGLEFGGDALNKARNVIQEGKESMGSGDLDRLTNSSESLNRTLTMFKGIVQRA
jgi:molecular chaperone DnaK